MSTEVEGKLVYDWADVDAGRCSPTDLWTQVPAPEQTTEPDETTIPTDEDLAHELAPFTADPQAIRWHVARRLFELSEIAARQSSKTHDSKASRDYVALTERLAKVLGLDAPKEVALQITARQPTSAKELTTKELEEIVRNATAIQGEATRVEE